MYYTHDCIKVCFSHCLTTRIVIVHCVSVHSCFLGLFTSTVFYIASVCGIGVMYSHYVPRPSCTLNIFFISWTAILLLVMMVISLHSKVSVCQDI